MRGCLPAVVVALNYCSYCSLTIAPIQIPGLLICPLIGGRGARKRLHYGGSEFCFTRSRKRCQTAKKPRFNSLKAGLSTVFSTDKRSIDRSPSGAWGKERKEKGGGVVFRLISVFHGILREQEQQAFLRRPLLLVVVLLW